MKKFMVIALAVALGGVAFASSLAVPWFVDNGQVANKIPPLVDGVCGVITLHNNMATATVCSIEYFTEQGVSVGPAAPNNTFVIPANSSVAFRPVATDPATVAGGQEGAVALTIPNRPSGTANGNDGKKNGSLVVRWTGNAQAVQGNVAMYGVATQTVNGLTGRIPYTYGHLLPPGMSN